MYSRENPLPFRDLASGLFLLAILLWSIVPFVADAGAAPAHPTPVVSVPIATLDTMVVTGHRTAPENYLTQADVKEVAR